MNFTRDEERGYSIVSKQPETPEEEAQCQEAMQNCPVEAIGDDGTLVTKRMAAQVAFKVEASAAARGHAVKGSMRDNPCQA